MTSTAPDTSRRTLFARTEAMWLLAFLIPFLALAVHQWGWEPPADAGDYAQYLLHAKAIVEGRPYAQTGYIFHPDAWTIGPPAYPPGLPLTLAPIVAVDGVHSPMIRVLMLASGAVFAFLAWRRLCRDVAPWQAAVGAGFAIFAIEARWGLLAPISDPGFAALMWATILAVDTTVEWSWRRIVGVSALGGAALAYRLTGVAVVGAFAIHAVLTWRRHRGRASIPVAIWGAAGLAALGAGVVHLSDLSELVAGITGALSRWSLLARQYRLTLFEMALYPGMGSLANQLYHVIVLPVIAWGLVLLARRVWRSYLAVTCLVYIVMLLAAPVGEERYLWPLYPVGACALAVGLTSVVAWCGRRFRWPDARAPRLAMLLVGSVAVAALHAEWQRPRPESLVETPDAQSLFRWLRQEERSSPMRVVFSNPRVLTLETGVPAMGNVELTAPGHLRAYAERRITHLIWQPNGRSDCLQRIANGLVDIYPERFALAYGNASFRVYRVLDAAAPRDSTYRQLGWSEVQRC